MNEFSKIVCFNFLDSDDDCLNNGQHLNNLFKSSMNRIDNTHATFLNCLRDWNDPFLLGRTGGAKSHQHHNNNNQSSLHLSSARSSTNVAAGSSMSAANNSSGCHRCESCACRSFGVLTALHTSSANTTLNYNPMNHSHNSSSAANTSSLSIATSTSFPNNVRKNWILLFYFRLISKFRRIIILVILIRLFSNLNEISIKYYFYF